MEEQEGKTWKGTASDLYNRLKEIIGEATGAEPTDEQPRRPRLIKIADAYLDRHDA